MTNSIGKPKRHKKSFQHLRKQGARMHRRSFIETSYVDGVYNENGELVIRPLKEEERDFLSKYYKEFVHGTFKTDKESTELFKKAKTLTKNKENIKFFKENGFFPEEVEKAIEEFNKKSKSLGNMAFDFFTQREINSDDYKRRYDIQNNSCSGVQLASFEDVYYVFDEDDVESTIIEDLITESENER